MKLEIELDLNKIDYDSINAQIQEKIKELDIKELYEIESRVSYKVDKKINQDISTVYDEYIISYWRTPTDKGKRLIDSLVTDLIREKVSELVDGVFNAIGEDTIKEHIVEMIPRQLTDIMAAKLVSAIEMSGYEMMEQTRNMCITDTQTLINTKLHQMTTY